MPDHHVAKFATDLSGKLAARSRHVCVRDDFLRQPDGHDFEQALSRLRRIAGILGGTTEKVDGLTADEARELDHAVCRLIVEALDVTKADLKPMKRLAAWAARADYHMPVELFTVNYDLLL